MELLKKIFNLMLLASLFLVINLEAGQWQIPDSITTMPGGSKLPYREKDGVKEFHLIAEPVKKEMGPGFFVDAWGYNGSTPGPVIEATEGDTVRIFVTNKLPEPTTIHWHGIKVPSGMDGVTGLSQKPIMPGETYKYEFTLDQWGTYMYHPHYDEMTQIALGMAGFFVIHPKSFRGSQPDRDFLIMLGEWAIPPGSSKPIPSEMVNFNYFTFNSTVWPTTPSLSIKTGEKVRIRFGNLSMNSHPIHVHGTVFRETSNGVERFNFDAQFEDVTVNVPVGSVREIEFTMDQAGDWAIHCHKSHHIMNGMGHQTYSLIDLKLDSAEMDKARKLIPGFMLMGSKGMGEMFSHEMHSMPRPKNFMHYGTPGPFGTIEMSGMFTVMKVRDNPEDDKGGWYQNPPGTVASPASKEEIEGLLEE
ncbi:multicopper oxidase family protein [Estrella lausannensis]|uniref:multicopper oxidase family protein n=1 Tax=Estrella lausannensis TaxID=483423 RepID=UPI001EF5B2B5|nr:copper oxidase [Estrella lausannensis]